MAIGGILNQEVDTNAKSILYNNAVSQIPADNVQDALDVIWKNLGITPNARLLNVEVKSTSKKINKGDFVKATLQTGTYDKVTTSSFHSKVVPESVAVTQINSEYGIMALSAKGGVYLEVLKKSTDSFQKVSGYYVTASLDSTYTTHPMKFYIVEDNSKYFRVLLTYYAMQYSSAVSCFCLVTYSYESNEISRTHNHVNIRGGNYTNTAYIGNNYLFFLPDGYRNSYYVYSIDQNGDCTQIAENTGDLCGAFSKDYSSSGYVLLQTNLYKFTADKIVGATSINISKNSEGAIEQDGAHNMYIEDLRQVDGDTVISNSTRYSLVYKLNDAGLPKLVSNEPYNYGEFLDAVSISTYKSDILKNVYSITRIEYFSGYAKNKFQYGITEVDGNTGKILSNKKIGFDGAPLFASDSEVGALTTDEGEIDYWAVDTSESIYTGKKYISKYLVDNLNEGDDFANGIAKTSGLPGEKIQAYII